MAAPQIASATHCRLEVERDHLWHLAAKGCNFESLRSQIEKRNRELREITDRSLSARPGPLEAELEDIHRFLNKSLCLCDIRSLLNRAVGGGLRRPSLR